MKNVLAILLFIGLLIPSYPLFASIVKQDTIKVTTAEKQDLKMKADEKVVVKQGAKITSDSIAEELRKKEIETKERKVNKNKKVKMFGVDENLSNTIRKRNIP
ncbi:MAG: hypothetical protein GZ094_02375 [Mariniphaga sp.]|nr:hypothetical protein [Mariniphaga sp.]